MKFLIPLITTLLLTASAVTLGAAGFSSETRVYKKAGDRELRLFIEKPAAWKATDRRPAVVFYFGGGWVGGSPTQFQPQSEYLATRGMVGIRVEYRVIPKGDKGPPVVCCQDAKSAMRWVRTHAAELGIDPQRIAAAGGSAGGHLAAFASMVDGVDDPADDLKISPKANALVLFNPVFDNGPNGGWGNARVGDRFKEFSPAHNITSAAPPTVVFLGGKDDLISVKVLERFKDGMSKAGVRCDTHIYDGQPHGFFNKDPYKTTTLIETDRFLASLGWLTGDPTLKKAAVAADQPAPFTPAADVQGRPGPCLARHDDLTHGHLHQTAGRTLGKHHCKVDISLPQPWMTTPLKQGLGCRTTEPRNDLNHGLAGFRMRWKKATASSVACAFMTSWPRAGSTRKVTATPAFFRASAKATAWPEGTSLSCAPWTMIMGGAPA